MNFSDDSDSDSDNEGSSSPDKDKFQINKTFATEYEKRKRREELLNAKQGGGDDSDDDSSSDESEDEDAELLTPNVDLQILKVCRYRRSHRRSWACYVIRNYTFYLF